MSVTINKLSDIVYIIRKNQDEVNIVTRNLNGQAAIQYQDEGNNVGTPGAVSKIDFVGANVSLALVGGKLTITISGGAAVGDVVGPASATDGNIALFDGTTGKLIKNSSSSPSSFQAASTALSQIAALSPVNDDIIQRKTGAWAARTIAQLIVDLIAGGIKNGTTTNDNASAGQIGEFVESAVASGSGVSLTTGTTTNVTSIILTAGDWDVSGVVSFLETLGTVTSRRAGVSTVSATMPAEEYLTENRFTTTVSTTRNSCALPRRRLSLAGTTTIYLTGISSFSAGTVVAYGFINARRIR